MKKNVDIVLSALSIALFISMAVLGWNQLSYGIFMLDEGMYMVDGWRLTVGDNLFPDSAISAIQLYGIFNAAIFSLNPDITLLGIREVAFWFNLISIVIFTASVFLWARRFWVLPFLLSIYMLERLYLSYHSYPRLFLLFYLAFMLLALYAHRQWLRNVLFILAGVALWGIGFSFTPLLSMLISPFLVWLAFRYFRPQSFRLTGGEVLLLIFPAVLLWLVFLLFYGRAFFDAIFDIYRYVQDGHAIEKSQGPAWQYFTVAALIASGLGACCRLPWKIFSTVLVLGSVAIYFIIDTNLFELVGPYWHGWFSVQLWFCAALIVGVVVVAINLSGKSGQEELPAHVGIVLVLLIPSVVFFIQYSLTSTHGPLAMLIASIPVIVALAYYFLEKLRQRSGEIASALLLIAFIMPFYAHMGPALWDRSTLFDAPSQYLTHTIPDGFAQGIKTNRIFSRLIDWMQVTSRKYSAEGDLAIVFDRVAMGYMLIKRRPALNHSWSGWALSPTLRRESISDALNRGRLPKIAYRFIRYPVIPPSRWNEPIKPPAFFTYANDDPVSSYVVNQMTLVDVFSVNGSPWVEFYVLP